MDKRALVFLGFLLIIASVSAISALDSTSVYAGETIEKMLPEAVQLVKGEIPAKVPDYKVKAELLDNTDTCLINCHLILNITSDIILIPSDVKASFKDVYGKEQVREYEYEYLATGIRAVDCPQESVEEINYTVFNNVTQENETVYENITVTDWVFCGLENYTYWESGLPLVGAGESVVVKIKGQKNPHENIDVIPELYGIKFSEWAWWNSSDAKMDYWLDDTNTSLWGEVNMTNGTIGMYYYGNCTKESESNGSAVFAVWDDFTTAEGYSYGAFGGQNDWTDTYSRGGAQIVPSESYFFKNGTTGSNNPSADKDYGAVDGTDDHIVEVRAKMIRDDSSYATKYIPYVWQSGGNAFAGAKWAEGGNIYADASGAVDSGEDWIIGVYDTIGWTQPTDNTHYDFFVNGGLTNANVSVINTGYWDGRVRWNFADYDDDVGINWLRSRKFTYNEPTIAYGDIETGSFNDGEGNTCGYRVEINITGTEDIDDYQVELNYTELGSNANGTLTFYYESGNPPVLISEQLGPAALYKNTTAWGAVSYNHTTNTTYTAVMGLAINGTIVGTFNQTNPTYANGTTWNYTSFDISAYTHGDNVSLWTYANVTEDSGDFSEINYTANITIGNYGPDIENLTITSPLYNDTNATGTADLWDLESDYPIACQFNWYVNDTSIYNDTQSPCTNTSTFDSGNYSETDIVHFGINATDSYGGAAAQVNSTKITVAGAFTINNYTYVSPVYETQYQNFTINFSISAGDENVSVNLEYHDTNITADCSNVSEVYECTITNLQAYPIASNGTVENATWWIDYDSLLAGAVTQDQEFNVTIYDGIWALNITSEAEAIEQISTDVNVTYGYASGIQGSVSGTALLGSSSGSFTCSAGSCTASVTAPDVETPKLYQTEANLTLTSSYWAETSTKEVRIEYSGYSLASSGACGGTTTNCANAYDGDWGTKNLMANLNDYTNLTFSFPEAYYLDSWNTYRGYGAASYWFNTTNIPDDCLAQEPLFKVANVYSDDFAFYCWNVSGESWFTIDSVEYNGAALYETSLNWTKNNSLTWVVPFGLTDCSSGVNFLNYSCRDEDDQSLITCNYSQTFTVVSAAGTTYETFSGEDTEWEICFYPETLEANISSIEQYSAAGYDTREFFLISVATGNTSYNLSRYLLSDTLGKFTIITVRENGVALEDAYVYANKYWVDSNTFTTVAMVKTDDDGRGATYLVPNTAWYRFSVIYEGETVHTSTTQHVICEESAYTCYVTLDVEDDSVDHWTYYEDISGGCTYQNATRRLVCDWADATGVMQYVNLTVYEVGVTATTLLCSNTSTSQSGTIFCDIPPTFTGTFTYSFWGKYNPEYYLDSGSVNLGEQNIWGDNGILIAILVFIVLAGVGVWSPPAGILMGLLALVALYTLGILDSDSGIGAIAGIGVAAVIAALRMRE